MTKPRFFTEHSSRRQPLWLCCLLLACLMGLQLHAPSHALSHALGKSSATALLPWDDKTDIADTADAQKTDAAAHGHTLFSDCCPAGLLAIGQNLPAAAIFPATAAAPASAPPQLATPAVFAPYRSRAPPV